MCANKEYEWFSQSVKLGNNFMMTVLGKGNIRLQVVGITNHMCENKE